MDKLEKEIKKYKLDELLFLLAELSRELYLKKDFMQIVEWKRYRGKIIELARQPLPAWSLADLSYIAINNSNDYRSLSPTKEDVYKLNNLLAIKFDEEAKKRKNEISQEDMKAHILLGYAQKQFWYQEIIQGGKILYNFLRYYVLLSEIPKYFQNHRLPNDDITEITGYDIKAFSQLLSAIWAYNYISSSSLSLHFSVTDDLRAKIPVLTEENLQNCLNFYTADYRYYRDPNFPNNPLFYKPVIKTDTNKLIISNCFILARKLYEGTYWIVRDKYMKQNSQYFLNNFGEYYERYIQEILSYYLVKEQYEKIKISKKSKSADWLIYTEKYILIVEQKSCLMTIALKEEYPSLYVLDEYLNNFKEAYMQISETVKALNKKEKQIIKLVLHFEKFYLGEAIIKERVNKLCKDAIDDLSNFYFIDTEEFEMLMQVLSESEEIFNKIVETKIDYEENAPISAGREFRYIIHKYAELENIKFLDTHKYLFDELFEGL